MNSKVILGFSGSDKVEIIHYVSRVGQSLGRKVLMMDLSETKALSYSIPTLDECEGIEYRGIDFTVIENVSLDEYDLILVDFGFKENHSLFSRVTCHVCVTDTQIHNVKRLNKLDIKATERVLFIKDIVKGKIGKKYVLNQLDRLGIAEDHTKEIYYDEIDLRLMQMCMYNDVFNFRKISWELKQAIISLFVNYYDTKMINKAFREAERGVR